MGVEERGTQGFSGLVCVARSYGRKKTFSLVRDEIFPIAYFGRETIFATKVGDGISAKKMLPPREDSQCGEFVRVMNETSF